MKLAMVGGREASREGGEPANGGNSVVHSTHAR